MRKSSHPPPDCVIHFAALKSVAKPLEYYANNVTGSANLLEVVQLAKVVFLTVARNYWSLNVNDFLDFASVMISQAMMEFGVKKIVFSSSATV